VDLHLTSEQELFRSTTRKFLEREASSAQVRSLAETGIGFDRSWWSTGAELGWTSLLVPEEMDGGSISDGPLGDLAILTEEFGRFAAPGPLAVTNAVIVGLVDSAASTEHKVEVAEIMSGAAVASWAVYDAGKGWDPFNPAMVATLRDGGYRLNGVKDRVESGDQADMFLVGAQVNGALTQFLVRRDAPGVTVEKMWSLDLTRHYARVTFDNVFGTRDSLVGDVGKALPTIERQCHTMFALQCAETVGVTDRYTFGRPLASYQVIKHRMASMKTWLEAMHATTVEAVRSVQARSDSASKLSRVAKLFTSRQAVEIIQDCIQIHGGIGVTWEHDLHIYLRRATVNRMLYGTPEELSRTLATFLAK
jgi:alkylation response protein AidB-like acyl-CoA dehydrogenase